jgi:hypothetical protein
VRILHLAATSEAAVERALGELLAAASCATSRTGAAAAPEEIEVPRMRLTAGPRTYDAITIAGGEK